MRIGKSRLIFLSDQWRITSARDDYMRHPAGNKMWRSWKEVFVRNGNWYRFIITSYVQSPYQRPLEINQLLWKSNGRVTSCVPRIEVHVFYLSSDCCLCKSSGHGWRETIILRDIIQNIYVLLYQSSTFNDSRTMFIAFYMFMFPLLKIIEIYITHLLDLM